MIADEFGAGGWEGIDRPLTRESLDGLLAWAAAEEASDIRLQTGKRIVLQVHGRVRKLGRYRLTEYDTALAANALRGATREGAADAMALVKAGRSFDNAYEVRPDRRTRLRFRIHGKGAYAHGLDGVALVCRVLPLATRPFSAQAIDPALAAALFPREGVVLLCGATGSGKTSLLGSVTREMLERPGSNRIIAEFSSPIENLFDDVDSPDSEITQQEVPRHSPDFAASVRDLMRSASNTAIVGECRDSETMGAAIHAGLTDHALYTTLHAARLREAMERSASLCPPAERAAMTVALAQALRLVLIRRLIPSVDRRRTPIHEWVALDRAARRRLAEADPLAWPGMVEAMAEERGTTFADAIRAALAEGRISGETAEEQLRHVA